MAHLSIKLAGDRLLVDSISKSMSDPNGMGPPRTTVGIGRYHRNDYDNRRNKQECWNSSASTTHERQDALLQLVDQSVTRDTGDENKSSVMPMIQEGVDSADDREELARPENFKTRSIGEDDDLVQTHPEDDAGH